MDYEENKIINGEEKLGSIVTSVRVSRRFYDLCKDNNIEFTEAIRVGIAVILAEKGVTPYDNDLNLYRKMILYQQELEKSLGRIEELKGYIDTINKLKDPIDENEKVKTKDK